jgi:hypothetical protein
MAACDMAMIRSDPRPHATSIYGKELASASRQFAASSAPDRHLSNVY